VRGGFDGPRQREARRRGEVFALYVLVGCLGGETLTLVGRIADIYEKTGASGTLDFVVLETEARDAEGRPVFFSRNTLISRRT